MPTFPHPLRRTLHVLILIVAAIFLGLHWVHLKADFPNHSPWEDWSKYTDEGWYGDAAIRHFQLGHWYLPGDFNPAAALPVWPVLEGLLFLVTGVSLLAARALTVTVFAGILVASWALIAKNSTQPRGLAAPAAVLLLAVSPFCFCFTRLAILEPLLVLLTLLALLIASTVEKPVNKQDAKARTLRQNLFPILALGILLPIMVLTKTTALFLIPAIVWMLFARTGYRILLFLRIALPAGLLAGALWSTYYFLVVHPHYLVDYRYLFSANAYTGITKTNAASVISSTFADGMWIDPVLYPCAGTAAIFALFRPKRLIANPLIPSLILWSLGYMAFLAYHNNLQPRYYLVVGVPLTLLLPVVIEQLVLPLFRRDIRRPAAIAAAALIIVIALPDASVTIKFVSRPEYTLLNAARQIDNYITADRKVDPSHSQLVLSISGSDLSLMTGLPSICDDFGTLELPDRIERYHPGWYVAWNEIDDDKMDAISPIYKPVRVATYPAMDDPERNLLILYRLDPPDGSSPTGRKPASVPKALRTKIGQQPTTSQLIH
jgi:hypothetical protein